ncbi:MAG: hypothetical protein OEM27_03200 [Nitrospinota bacterium]|nr:hypothetical protein [Nitrospinota bacterium]
MGIATPAWALDWHDPEWTSLGCPSKLSGDWYPLTASPYAGLKIEFKPTGAALSSNENSTVFFAFTPNPKEAQYFNLKQLSADLASFPGYIKIRPHIAVQSNSEGKKYTLCKIKVFLFESKQKADKMSYISWDIYSTIDSLEVPNGS